jgi:hypothetical protein
LSTQSFIKFFDKAFLLVLTLGAKHGVF